MPTSGIHYDDNQLYAFIELVRERLNNGDIKREETLLQSDFGVHSIQLLTDEDTGEEYALAAFTLPYDVYVEIEDSTYGELQGFRIYRGQG